MKAFLCPFVSRDVDSAIGYSRVEQTTRYDPRAFIPERFLDSSLSDVDPTNGHSGLVEGEHFGRSIRNIYLGSIADVRVSTPCFSLFPLCSPRLILFYSNMTDLTPEFVPLCVGLLPLRYFDGFQFTGCFAIPNALNDKPSPRSAAKLVEF